MNDYHLQKLKEQRDRQSSSQQGGKGMQYVKVQYKDPDMQMLASQNKGTTQAYDYS